MVTAREAGGAAVKEFIWESSAVRGESSHHTNGSKAPRSAHVMLCGTLAIVEICGMIVSFMQSGWFGMFEINGINVLTILKMKFLPLIFGPLQQHACSCNRWEVTACHASTPYHQCREPRTNQW
uniref:Uncharacterized protein n=1 Tax=Lactuca sativa TaxID=4236 RepID=A0A9R1WKW0_LACSA|nr:hypothetical protein LSAT_V11C100017050 [Lactuca sativa]